ncbi:MAG TPA: hypothetical protein VFA10_12210 [Ktedonobacteraceae bacterium]|nr:hypothetical protein [Ktedonobacteraceae bacterium]
MQSVPLRSIKASLSRRMRSSGEDILHFSLQGVLPSGHLLAVNPLLGTLSYIVNEDHHPRLIMQQQFTAGEMSVLMPLLEAYPYYCPYDTLLASFQYGNVTEATVERCREHLQEAQEEGIWDQEMRPMRNVLSRARLKLRTFGIEVSTIVETGYILMYLPQRKRKEA